MHHARALCIGEFICVFVCMFNCIQRLPCRLEEELTLHCQPVTHVYAALKEAIATPLLKLLSTIDKELPRTTLKKIFQTDSMINVVYKPS